jgi:hypothetical protein
MRAASPARASAWLPITMSGRCATASAPAHFAIDVPLGSGAAGVRAEGV